MRAKVVQGSNRAFLGFPLLAVVGAVLLFGLTNWVLWRESMDREERRVAELARVLGEETEQIIVDARALLDRFNQSELPRCGEAHISALHREAVAKPYIRAIGYWRATERLCGVGYIQAVDLKPSRADRIYDNGMLAWWPSTQTRVGGVKLFLIRYGDHDLAIDPRMLLRASVAQGRTAGLWVEGLPMARTAESTDLPTPESIPVGLTVDQHNSRLVSRFSLGTIFPIDVVAVDSFESYWDRYLTTLLGAAALAVVIASGWIYLVLRYSRHRGSLETQLREALANGHIEAYYQPIVALESGNCVGAEALARWVREDGEAVPPDVFIVIAEAAGLLPRITLALVQTTLRDLGEALRERPDISININLAAEDMKGDNFKRELHHCLAANNVPASSIKLEITERTMVNSDASRSMISAFREAGHHVAVDDFGTGYSSLAYLQSFELDTLKIDKSFVDAIGTEAVTSPVVGHVIELAKSLSLDIVAEGIETELQATWLREKEVEYGQGYFFSRALPAQMFLEYLQASDRGAATRSRQPRLYAKGDSAELA